MSAGIGDVNYTVFIGYYQVTPMNHMHPNELNTDVIWRNTMKKKYVSFAVIFLLMICFPGCGKEQYDEDEIIGLTSYEIVEKYGDFDRKQDVPGRDGLYRDCGCGYLISEERVGFFGTTPPKYFMIYFNEDGIAHYCRYEEVV